MQIPHGASRIDLPRSGSYGRVGGVEPTRSADLPSRHFAATMLGGASRACEFDPSPFAAPEYSVLGMHAWLALAVQVVCVVFVCRGQGLSGPAQGRVWAAARGTGDETRHGGGSHCNGGTFSNLTQHSSRSQTLAINKRLDSTTRGSRSDDRPE